MKANPWAFYVTDHYRTEQISVDHATSVGWAGTTCSDLP